MSQVPTVDAPVLAQKLNGGEVLLIDVREADEFAVCHIPNAVSVPLSCLDSHLDVFKDEDRPIVFQCQRGVRGEMAAEKALNGALKGKQIHNLVGGIEAWQQAALPTIVKSTGQSKNLPLNRQVFIAVGSLVLIGSLLVLAGIKAGAILTLLVSFGLLIAGLTGWCGMAILLQKMPWNR